MKTRNIYSYKAIQIRSSQTIPFYDTKGVIVSRTSKNDRQYNGQKEKAQKIMHKTVHGKEQ